MRLPTRTRVPALLAAAAIAAAAVVGGLAAGITSRAGHSEKRTDRATARRPVTPPEPRISVYGDSLTVQAAPYLTVVGNSLGLHVAIHAFSGTAPCDYLAVLRKELASHPPALVLFAFSGNSVATCMLEASGHPLTGDAVVAKYRADTEAAADATTQAHRPFVVASPPVARGKEAVWKALDAIYRDLAATHVGVQYADAGQDIAPGGQFTTTQQCLPFETKLPGAQPTCRSADSTITVRGPDGGHFCGDASATTAVACPTYASGAMRYAINLVSAAKLTLDAPATRIGL
jgi:hypothetical protein